jgi:hypothetical protein
VIIVTPTKFYAYAVVNVATTPQQLVAVGMSRQLAKQEKERQLDQGPLRVRRCKLTVFET